MNNEIIKITNKNNINIKHLYIYMDEIITNSLNEGNIHFFITINVLEKIKSEEKIIIKTKKLENIIENIEMLSWYNISIEKNKKGYYHYHFILAIKSLIGFNDVLGNNIKYYLINNFEIDSSLSVCWSFIDIKKTWKYLYKDFQKESEKEENKKKNKEKEYKKRYKEYEFEFNELDPVFMDEKNYNENNEKNKKNGENLKTKKRKEKPIIIFKINKNIEFWFEKIKREILIEEIEQNENKIYFDNIKGVKIDEKNYNERQVFFLWDFFLILNNMVLYKNNIFIKIEDSIISFKEFKNINFLFENIYEIFLFFKNVFPFQFNNFDELNFNSKFIKNMDNLIKRYFEFSSRKVNFNFNVMEFKDGVYSILFNKFIRKNKFEKKNNLNLEKILMDKNIFTIKYYKMSFENLKEPSFWLDSIENVMGLKERTNTITDRIANFIKKDDREWLLVYIAYIFHYSTNELNKQNTLYIWGPSNTGKTTLIVNLFINYFGKNNIGLVSNNKNFEYQHILNKNLIIFDEFDIKKIDIDNFKKLLSKELVLGEKKGKEPEFIKPAPILISSNYNLDYKLNLDENKTAITNRLKIINFNKSISNNEMDNSISCKMLEEEAKIIVYCNKIYFNKIKKGKKNRMDNLKLIEII